MTAQHLVPTARPNIPQLVNRLRRIIRCSQHQHLAVGKEPHVSIVFDQMNGPIELVLETVFAIAHVAGLTDVASVELDAMPFDVHLTPRQIRAAAQHTQLNAPDPARVNWISQRKLSKWMNTNRRQARRQISGSREQM